MPLPFTAPRPTPPPAPAAPAAAAPAQATSDLQRIKERLAKLLRLGQDAAATPGEIENAMRIATELMARHQLTRDDIDTGAQDPMARLRMGRHFAFGKGARIAAWETRLASFVCNFLATVRCYIATRVPLRSGGIPVLDGDGNVCHGAAACFYGPEQDAEVAVEMFSEIRDDIARMAIIRFGGWARGDGAAYAEGFAAGLELERQNAIARLRDADAATTALILQGDATTLAIREKAKAWLVGETGLQFRKSRRKGSARGRDNAVRQGLRDGAAYQPSRPTVRPKLG